MRYYMCTNAQGTVYIQPSERNLAAFLSVPDRARNAQIMSDDGSFRLTMRGVLIETCSDLKLIERLRPMIVYNQLARTTPMPDIQYYRGDPAEQNKHIKR